MGQSAVRNVPSGTCESGGGIPASERGFTLLELLVTILIAGILVTIAVPSFQSIIKGTQRRSAISAVSDAIATARAEAVTRGVPVTLCATANPGASTPACSNVGWEQGILVTAATGPIQVWGAAASDIDIAAISGPLGGSVSSIIFSVEGTVATPATLWVCDDQGASEAAAIVINVSGLSRVAADTDGNGVVENHLADNVSC